MKTNLTCDIEKALLWELSMEGNIEFACPEVTIGWHGHERVDMLSMDAENNFRCFEVKISKSDFRSKSAHTFVGHYNYYVMPMELYQQVKNEVPDGVGVWIAGVGSRGKMWICSKALRPKRQEIDAPMLDKLKNSLIRSLHRELVKRLTGCCSMDCEYAQMLGGGNREVDDEQNLS